MFKAQEDRPLQALDPMQSTSSSFCAHTTTKWQYCHAEHDSLCVHPPRRCSQAFCASPSFSRVAVLAYCCFPWRMKCIVCTAIFGARASALLSSVSLSVRLKYLLHRHNSSGLASDYHHSCTCFPSTLCRLDTSIANRDQRLSLGASHPWTLVKCSFPHTRPIHRFPSRTIQCTTPFDLRIQC